MPLSPSSSPSSSAAASVPSLSQMVAVVTGGSRGLGACIAEALCAEGARVVVADIAADRARACAAELVERGGKAEAAVLDVGDEEAVRATLRDVQERHGRLDVVVNNAAIDITVPVAELPGSDFERIVRTNLVGPFLVARQASLLMSPPAAPGSAAPASGAVPRTRGHIVNIASTASKRAWPNASAYHATKWGLLGLSHALHAELRPQGIKVSAIVAGGMRTPFLLDRFPDIDPGVLQDPGAVARAVLFVLSQPEESVVPEVMVLPMRESSWP